MLVLASYFPYEMSADSDGLWSFRNRHGYPVGVNLSEDDDRWAELWEKRYPSAGIELRGLDDAMVRRLCCPEWLAADGAPLERKWIRLYGTASSPSTSDENMASYLDRLRILMEAGALRSLFPYGMELQWGGAWVLFNRDYKPVGVNLGVGPGEWIRYRDWPVRVRLAGLDHRTLAGLSYTGAYDEARGFPGQHVHFYDDASVPTVSARNMETYLAKLGTVVLLDGASNSKAPWPYRLARYAGKTVADAGPVRIGSVLLKLFRG